MSEMQKFSIADKGYFGISHLDMGSYAAHLMNNSLGISQNQGLKLHFDEAAAYYHPEKRALTIEGNAGSISTPGFAVKSLEAYAKIARQMDDLAKPFAS